MGAVLQRNAVKVCGNATIQAGLGGLQQDMQHPPPRVARVTRSGRPLALIGDRRWSSAGAA